MDLPKINEIPIIAKVMALIFILIMLVVLISLFIVREQKSNDDDYMLKSNHIKEMNTAAPTPASNH